MEACKWGTIGRTKASDRQRLPAYQARIGRRERGGGKECAKWAILPARAKVSCLEAVEHQETEEEHANQKRKAKRQQAPVLYATCGAVTTL